MQGLALWGNRLNHQLGQPMRVSHAGLLQFHATVPGEAMQGSPGVLAPATRVETCVKLQAPGFDLSQAEPLWPCVE